MQSKLNEQQVKAIEKAKKLKQKAVDNNEIIKKDENNNTK
jgi:hypothetical protein